MSKKPDPSVESAALPRSPEIMAAETSALLVVDAQEKLLSIIPGRATIVWNIRRLLDAAALLGVPASGTEQYPDKLSPTVPVLKERLGPLPDKLCFNAAACPQVFEKWEQEGRDQVLVCGVETHVCVAQTALDLSAAGFRVFVAVDAVGARFSIDHATSLRRMEAAGVVLTTTEAAFFEWCRTAAAPEFKAISSLAKESPPG